MKQRPLVFSIGFVFISFFCNAQEIVNEKEAQTIQALKMCLFISNLDGRVYLDHHQYDYQRDKANNNLIMTAKVNPGVDNELIGDRFHSYEISEEEGKTVIKMKDYCEEVHRLTLTWEENKVSHIAASIGYKSGKVIYDKSSRIIGLDLGQTSSKYKSKLKFENTYRKIKVNEQGIIEEVNEELLVFKPSNSNKKLKEDYRFISKVAKIDYGTESTTLNFDYYKMVKDERINIHHMTSVLTKNNLSTTEKSVTQYYNAGNGQSRADSLTIQMEYNQDLKIIKKSSISQDVIVTSYHYNSDNHLLTQTIESTLEGGITEKAIKTNEYNEFGVVQYEKVEFYTNETYAGIKESKFNPQAKDKRRPMSKCNSIPGETTVEQLDGDGNLIMQVVNGSRREKVDGVWGPWSGLF